MVALHAQILGWFAHPSVYNKIGFLVVCAENRSKALGSIITNAKCKKSAFELFLANQIKAQISISSDDLDEITYDKHYSKLLNLLLLMNIETVSKTKERFPFAHHVGMNWSLEHIHAQSAMGLTTNDQRSAWLADHSKALSSVETAENKDKIQSLQEKIKKAVVRLRVEKSSGFSGSDFEILSRQVLDVLSLTNEPDHSIVNLALLSQEHNSALNNAVFEVKRQRVMERDRQGEYVPVCTRNVFLKYYADANAQQPHFWGPNDKESYRMALLEILQPYLNKTVGNNHE